MRKFHRVIGGLGTNVLYRFLQTTVPGTLGNSSKDASFLSHLQNTQTSTPLRAPRETVLNMDVDPKDPRHSSLGQSPQPLIRAIKDELMRLSQGKTPITEL